MKRFDDLLRKFGNCVSSGDTTSIRITCDEIIRMISFNKISSFLDTFDFVPEYSLVKANVNYFLNSDDKNCLKSMILDEKDLILNLKELHWLILMSVVIMKIYLLCIFINVK